MLVHVCVTSVPAHKHFGTVGRWWQVYLRRLQSQEAPSTTYVPVPRRQAMALPSLLTLAMFTPSAATGRESRWLADPAFVGSAAVMNSPTVLYATTPTHRLTHTHAHNTLWFHCPTPGHKRHRPETLQPACAITL